MLNLFMLSPLRRKNNLLLPFTLFAAAFAACAGDGDGDDSPSAPSQVSGNNNPSEPNQPDDKLIGPKQPGGDDTGELTRRGGQVILSSLSSPTTSGFLVDARFWGVYGTPDAACQQETVGACQLFECPPPSGSYKGEYAKGSYQAGRITVEGGLQPAVIEAGATSVSGASDLFQGGERLFVRAESGEVPAFEGTVLGPGRVTFTEPRPALEPTPGDRTFVVSPSRDLTVRWTGGAAGTTVRAFVERNGDAYTSTGPRASCTFDAGAGTGVIPAAALERLAKSKPGVSLYFAVNSETRVEAGDVSVLIQATAPAVDANNISFGGLVSFE